MSLKVKKDEKGKKYVKIDPPTPNNPLLGNAITQHLLLANCDFPKQLFTLQH